MSTLFWWSAEITSMGLPSTVGHHAGLVAQHADLHDIVRHLRLGGQGQGAQHAGGKAVLDTGLHGVSPRGLGSLRAALCRAVMRGLARRVGLLQRLAGVGVDEQIGFQEKAQH
ncbi:hypothetical protein G6F65_023052 [Rhizopus arrhizus]|nr:hypothetical protein G6F65_023052 [Rhizopus arrhizus]